MHHQRTELIYMQNVSYSTVRSTWTVSCFRADIFVFLLSTRAGGLGINLTAADTVSNLILCFIGSYLVRIHLTISQSRAFAFCFFFRRPGQIARNLGNDRNWSKTKEHSVRNGDSIFFIEITFNHDMHWLSLFNFVLIDLTKLIS